MKLNPSVKHHLIIGAVLCAWAFIFAFFSRPFEHGYMDLRKWIEVSVGFSLITFLAYVVVTYTQYFIFRKLSKWTILLEVSMYVLFYTFYTIVTYLYYSGGIVRGIYDFPTFFTKIIVNIIVILTPIIAIVRHYSLRLLAIQEKELQEATIEEDIVIRGTNKLDFLKIKQSELVCISNTQNYVEVFFLENDVLQTKLIRNSLKQIQEDLGFLVQIHRSHLINPHHFKSWKDAGTIILTQKELPVSKTYKNNLLSL
ncbi:MAG TPA: LytTR family transcriptional regulator [Microscillaceae bacterium]|nr:LytTR family transcriptional regulator [Microscillaceae bacterium]